MKYRSDINWLRALAIISVVLYHTNIYIFSSGYLWVEIFFVISWYLITSIILYQILDNTFSFTKFYKRRIRRILPALLFVTLITTLIYWIIADPILFEEAWSSISSIWLFMSNMYFMLTLWDYFWTWIQTKLFLHTRSLSIEEQYYLLIPIILFVLMKYVKRQMLAILFSLFILSYLYFIYLININPNSNFSFFWILPNTLSLSNNSNAWFYFLLSRSWEFIAWWLLAYKHIFIKIKNKNITNQILGILGLVLIFISTILYFDIKILPGYLTLIPVLWTLFIIESNNQWLTFIWKLLSNKIFKFFGDISYSLYLWHWPILVFLYYYYWTTDISIIIIIEAILFTIFISYFSYKYIENPFRIKKDKEELFKNKTIYILMSFIIILITLGLYIKLNNGIPGRLPDKVQSYSNYKIIHNKYSEIKNRKVDNNVFHMEAKFIMIWDEDKEPSFIIIWDSHAGSVYPVLKSIAEKSNITGIFVEYAWCFPLKWVNTQYYDDGCIDIKEETYSVFKNTNSIKNILIIWRWEIYIWKENQLYPDYIKTEYSNIKNKILISDSLTKLKKEINNKNIWIMKQVPILNKEPIEYLSMQAILNPSKELDMNDYTEKIASNYKQYKYNQKDFDNIFSSIPKINILDPSSILCNKNSYCDYYDKTKWDILYRDSNHLNIYWAYYIEKLFEPFFEQLK